MIAFDVWLRPLGNVSRVRVDESQNATWLLDRLHGLAKFGSTQPMSETGESRVCSFEVTYEPPLSRSAFEQLVTGIPEVQMMRLPE
jgi:hypothetical protein